MRLTTSFITYKRMTIDDKFTFAKISLLSSRFLHITAHSIFLLRCLAGISSSTNTKMNSSSFSNLALSSVLLHVTISHPALQTSPSSSNPKSSPPSNQVNLPPKYKKLPALVSEVHINGIWLCVFLCTRLAFLAHCDCLRVIRMVCSYDSFMFIAVQYA